MGTLLEPSHELDKRASEIVLGWRDHSGMPAVKPPGADSRPFRPSVSIEDAFILVDKVLEVVRGQFRLERGHRKWSTVTFFGKHNDEELTYAFAAQPSEPLAICEAAIEVMTKHRDLEAALAKVDAEDHGA